jgi:PTH1 family peptidyl-tRNA hydrolase
MAAGKAWMKLIVGLGNPGRRYVGTRHNIGWEVVAAVARRCGGGYPRARFDGEVVEVVMADEKTLLLCPHTYMNLSGSSVQPARDFHQLQNEDLIVVCDDFNLPLAKLRFRAKGSSGGQKGLDDIIRRLGTDQFPRLRIGIGTPPPQWDVAAYVLSKFADEERKVIDVTIPKAVDALVDWVRHGVDYCMNRYNGS